MANIYRIIDFPVFINLIENRVEWYSKPFSWEDTYEGYWYRKLNNEEQVHKTVEFFFNKVSIDNSEGTLKNVFKLWWARYNCFGQCWSKQEESDALWRIYSYDKKSVQIRTTDIQLEEIASKFADDFSYTIDDVKYDLDYNNLEKIQSLNMDINQRSIEPFFHKRLCFFHEEEKRIILTKKGISGFYFKVLAINTMFHAKNRPDFNSNMTREDWLKILSEEAYKTIQSENNIFSDSEKGYLLKISKEYNLSDYITGVRVNPFAEDYFVNLVKSVCKKNGLEFLGKSEMYAVVK